MSKLQEEWKFYKEITRSNQYFKKGDILTVSDYGNVLLNGQPYECKINKKLGYKILAGEYLHRIVAEKFLHDWDPTKQVDHKDTNRLNNRVDNLCMVTHKENCNNPLTRQHNSQSQKLCYVENRRPKIPWSKGKAPWNKGQHWDEETKKKIVERSHKKSVLQYTLDNKFVAEYVSISEASRQTKILASNISRCCQHKKRYKSAGGYIWKYKEE